jgi:hypothetical protein
VALVAFLVASGLVLRSEQQLPLTFNQGIAHVPGGWIVSGTNSPLPATDDLAHVDEDLNVLAVNPAAIPAAWRAKGYSHIGDIDVVGNVIYAPFEQPMYELGHQATARYDLATLGFIDAVELVQHENSFVAVDPSTMTAYSMDRFDGDSLLRYDIAAGWAPLPELSLPKTLHHTQGASVANGSVWIATSDDHNGVYEVDLATGAIVNEGTLGHQGAEGEGIDATALESGALHALVNDPRNLTVWLDHYDVAGRGTSGPGVPADETGTSTPGGELAATGGATSLPIAALIAVVAALSLEWVARRARRERDAREPAA